MAKLDADSAINDKEEENIPTLSENQGVDPDQLDMDKTNSDISKQDEDEEDELDPRIKMMEGESQDADVHPDPIFDTKIKEEPEAQDKQEHTLDDLAEESNVLPAGVRPVPDKSFRMSYQDENQDENHSQIPHLGSQFASSGVYSNREPKNNSSKLKLLILAVIALLVVAAALYLLKGKSLFKRPESVPSESPVISTPENTPAPTPAFDRTQYKIRVLNGTSTSGLAASVSAKLKGLGYQSDKVGNATNSAFTKTVVRVKDSATGLLDNLISDLSPDYNATESGKLDASDSADGEVIIGTK